ncbi:MAG: dihydroxy-acid dehydratase, partial [Deltaproteobacteria bacterium]|nr:dihydroxy-acid dehydratase [Deltaproteobacteria bacterium]
SEALGMAWPGSALIPASLADIGRLSRQAGRQIMELAQKGIRPSEILTPAAFENAIKIHAAIGGSTNALLHLPAIAHELGFKVEAEQFDQLNRVIPYLTNIQPSGEYLTELFWYAGGIPRVQKELRGVLDLKVMTVTGKTLAENLEQLEREGFFRRGEGYLANYKVKREDIIRQAENSKGAGSIAVLKGNLAPEGAVVKYSAVASDMLTHEGPVRVFNREEDAFQAILQGRIQAGSVIVIRYEGPRGSGMPEILATTEALATNPDLHNTAIVTDGRFSGATRGPCIGHVSPEAARGGPIAVVEDGDLISIDIPSRILSIVGCAGKKMNPQAIQAVMAERQKRWQRPLFEHPRGILQRYSTQAASAMRGAYLMNEEERR